MEREILFTGIGGQGIQLAAQVLARAALAEGREVMLFGSYGGTMRGGPPTRRSSSRRARVAPPIVSRAWSAIAMHPPTSRRRREARARGGRDREHVAVRATDRGRSLARHGVPATSSRPSAAARSRARSCSSARYASRHRLVALDALIAGSRNRCPSGAASTAS
jgi:hypothetical protein